MIKTVLFANQVSHSNFTSNQLIQFSYTTLLRFHLGLPLILNKHKHALIFSIVINSTTPTTSLGFPLIFSIHISLVYGSIKTDLHEKYILERFLYIKILFFTNCFQIFAICVQSSDEETIFHNYTNPGHIFSIFGILESGCSNNNSECIIVSGLTLHTSCGRL
jgi:hypothetical protein